MLLFVFFFFHFAFHCSDEHILTITKALASQPLYRQYMTELFLFQSKMNDAGAIAIAQVRHRFVFDEVSCVVLCVRSVVDVACFSVSV